MGTAAGRKVSRSPRSMPRSPPLRSAVHVHIKDRIRSPRNGPTASTHAQVREERSARASARAGAKASPTVSAPSLVLGRRVAAWRVSQRKAPFEPRGANRHPPVAAARGGGPRFGRASRWFLSQRRPVSAICCRSTQTSCAASPAMGRLRFDSALLELAPLRVGELASARPSNARCTKRSP